MVRYISITGKFPIDILISHMCLEGSDKIVHAYIYESLMYVYSVDIYDDFFQFRFLMF